MAKNGVEGVYSADPALDEGAEFIPEITHREALTRGLEVMDATAFALFAVGLTKFFPASAAGTIPATHSQSTTPLLPKPNEILGIGPL